MPGWPYNTKTWRKLREIQLNKYPLCADCEKRGRLRGAEEVDHIIPIKAGGAVFDPENLQSLCRRCHSRKTTVEDGGGGNPKRIMPGCDAHGWPLDEEHSWNRETER